MIGERVKQARHLRALSLRDLGKRAGLSAQALSKYERNLNAPSSGTLLRLARALDLSVEFFVRPRRVSNLHWIESTRPLHPKQERHVLALIRDWLERYLEIEAIRDPEGSGFLMPAGFPREVSTEEEIEETAVELRKAWQRGLGPIENLTELLEDRGLKIGLFPDLDFEMRTVMAVVAENPIPVIVGRIGLTGERQRFLLASELARLMICVSGEERAADLGSRFAGAFLVPASVARFELGHRRSSIGPHELHLLKHKHGLSMSEWLRRAADLDILTESRFQSIRRQLRAHGWLEQEPGDPYPEERPSRFYRLVMQALEEKVIVEKRAGELLGQPIRRFLDQFAEEHGDFPVALGY